MVSNILSFLASSIQMSNVILQTELYHVSDDIRLIFLCLHWVPTQRHIVALLNPHQVGRRQSRSWRKRDNSLGAKANKIQPDFQPNKSKGHVINDSAELTGSSGPGHDSGTGRSLTDAVEAFHCELVQSVAL